MQPPSPVNDAAYAPRVFLAEDDPAFRELLETELEAHGLQVVTLRDGRELLRRLIRALDGSSEGSPPDLIVSDVRMPGYDGLAVLEALHRAGTRVPVVLISAFADEELREQARRAGAFAVVEKPFEIDTLLAVVDEAVRRDRLPAAV